MGLLTINNPAVMRTQRIKEEKSSFNFKPSKENAAMIIRSYLSGKNHPEASCLQDFDTCFNKAAIHNQDRLNYFKIQNDKDTPVIERLTQRESDLKDVNTFFAKHKSYTFLGFVGWGEYCIPGIKPGKGTSSLEGFLFKDQNGDLHYQRIGSCLEIFSSNNNENVEYNNEVIATKFGENLNLSNNEVSRHTKDGIITQSLKNYEKRLYTNNTITNLNREIEAHRGAIKIIENPEWMDNEIFKNAFIDFVKWYNDNYSNNQLKQYKLVTDHKNNFDKKDQNEKNTTDLKFEFLCSLYNANKDLVDNASTSTKLIITTADKLNNKISELFNFYSDTQHFKDRIPHAVCLLQFDNYWHEQKKNTEDEELKYCKEVETEFLVDFTKDNELKNLHGQVCELKQKGLKAWSDFKEFPKLEITTNNLSEIKNQIKESLQFINKSN